MIWDYLQWGVSLTLLAGVAALLYFMRRDNQTIGKEEAKSEAQNEILEDIEKANAARDRLNYDPAYADSVRRRFDRRLS